MKRDVYANSPLDFNTLSHREFEEVVYHYFIDQINKGFYDGINDAAELSSGVGENGYYTLFRRQNKRGYSM